MTNKLSHIANVLESWLEFNKAERDKEGVETTDDTHIMSPPKWPTRGQLKAWIEVMREGEMTEKVMPTRYQVEEAAMICRNFPKEDFQFKPCLELLIEAAQTPAPQFTMERANRKLDSIIRFVESTGEEKGCHLYDMLQELKALIDIGAVRVRG